ncbi:MAG: cation:proton antiporter [Waddliaceae bacterium]
MIIFGLSIVVLLICHRLKVPGIVGFLITGIVAGPSVLGFVSAGQDVKLLAEIGIIVLLFTVGLEFSVKRILEYKRYFMIAGPIQVSLTIAGGLLAGQLLNRPLNESIFLGFLVSLSSTAIVMRILQERAETNSPHGRLSLGILIFQDVAVVLMMLVIPFLSGAEDIEASVLLLLGQGVVILVITFYAAVKLVPRLLFYVAKARSRELFLLTVLVICFSVTWITSAVGLTLALGAFLAGLIISDSEFSTQAIGDIIPLQDIFTSFFFISIGMLLDINFFIEQIIPILLLAFGILLLKSIIVGATGLVLGLSVRTSILSGMAISQVGEFSFVLASAGFAYGFGTEYLHQVFIAVAILTMGVTPTLIGLSPKLANWALELPLPHIIKSGKKGDIRAKSLQNHIIIVGYGFSGRNLARSSREAEIPYVIIDMDPETVRKESRKGEPIYFGDATRDRVLSHANIEHAQVVAILVEDPIAALRIVQHARKMNASVYIVVRTRYLEEMQALYQMGADDVIPDELGSTVEIFTRVLTKYHLPKEHIDQLIQALRIEGYDMLRPRYSEETLFSDLKEHLSEIRVKTLHVKESSPIIGMRLKQLEFRRKYGVTVLVIKRGSDTIYKIDPDNTFFSGDEVVVAGTEENILTLNKLFFS